MFALVGLGAGFVVGFALGGSTRDAVAGATSTTYQDGKILISIDASQALREGLSAFLS